MFVGRGVRRAGLKRSAWFAAAAVLVALVR